MTRADLHYTGLRKRLTTALRHPLSQNAIAMYAVQLIITFMPLVTLPWLARVLGPQELGRVVYVQSTSFVLGIVVEFGFGLSASRRIAHQRGDRDAIARTVADVQGAKVWLIAASTLVSVVLLFVVPVFREQPVLMAFVWAMALAQGLGPIWYFTAVERLRFTALMEVLLRTLTAAAIVLLVRDSGQGMRVLWIWTIGAWVIVAVLNVSMYRAVDLRRPTPNGSRRALREAWPLFLAGAGVSLYTAGTIVVLGLVVTSAQIAVFSSAERVVRASLRVVGPIGSATYPRINYLLGQGQAVRAKYLSHLTLWSTLAVALVVMSAFLVGAPFIVDLVLGDDFADAVPIMRVLSLLLPLIAVHGTVSGQVLLPNGLDIIVTRVVLVSAVLSLTSTIVVGELVGPVGVAWSLVLLEAGMATLVTTIARRRDLMLPLFYFGGRFASLRMPTRPS